MTAAIANRDAAAPRSGGDTERVWLRELAIRDFRNLRRLDLRLPPDGIAIIGDNGQGKTNLLEAIYYLQLLRSMRGARDNDLTAFGAAGFHLAATVAGAERRDIGIGYERQTRRKRVLLDGNEASKLSEALGALPAVVVAPSDVQLVSGGPADRRRYLDVTLSLSSRRYLAALQRYRAALLRRNAALREMARTGRDQGAADVWEPALAENGAVLRTERAAWVDASAPEFTRLCTAIGESGEARMRYVSTAASDVAPEEQIARALASQRANDARRGLTHSGPHRDDVELTLAGRELRLFGSGGQQRTAAIALRMLEAATLRRRFGAEPLLLLDDPFAELDARRSSRILELLRDAGLGQTVLAVPRASDIPPELTRLDRWRVSAGELSALAHV
jgi:DNA replication and repair protein RecF